eukprot:6172258-Pleurochrysis_carterae.AAC.2
MRSCVRDVCASLRACAREDLLRRTHLRTRLLESCLCSSPPAHKPACGQGPPAHELICVRAHLRTRPPAHKAVCTRARLRMRPAHKPACAARVRLRTSACARAHLRTRLHAHACAMHAA